jgi:dTDP-glucose 4,6-dehydratase
MPSSSSKRILVTGGAGFIGSALVRHLIGRTAHHVLNLDRLTYAGTRTSLRDVEANPRYAFRRVDICDGDAVSAAFADFRPQVVMHLAAETHVDRSIEAPGAFIRTNVVGTFTLLREAATWWRGLPALERRDFRFHHVSTDEVFGSLGAEGAFNEASAYDPRSPYSASKAGADHLVRAWHHTYGLPTLITNCSNNYGPCQFPEKLIPLMTIKALSGDTLPVYGRGDNVRDWLFVEDHVRALEAVVERGAPGETYAIGGDSEVSNLAVVEALCDRLDALRPRHDGRSHREQIAFVADRPGHDHRYAIDATKIRRELGWRPTETFQTGLAKTIDWYLDHEWWWREILEQRYAGERLGIAG